MSEAKPQSKSAHILNLSKDSIVYGIGIVTANFSALILTKMLTTTLTIADFGTLDIIQSFIAIASAFLGFYMESALIRYYYDYDARGRSTLIFTHLSSVIIIGLAAVVAGVLVKEYLSQMLLRKDITTIIQWYYFLAIPTLLVYQHIVSVLRIMRKAKILIAYTIFVSVIQVLFVTFLVFWHHFGVNGVFVSIVLSQTIGAVFFFSYFWRHYEARYCIVAIKKLLKYGVPLLPDMLLGFVISYCSRYFLMTYHEGKSIGMFSVAQKIASFVAIGIGAFRSSWIAYVFSIEGKGEGNNEFYKYVFSTYLKTMWIIVALLIVYCSDAIMIVSKREYLPSTFSVGICAVAVALQGSIYIVNIGIHISKKTKYYIIISLCGATSMILAGSLLIPRWGLEGAALAHVITQLLMVIIAYTVSGQLYRINFNIYHLVVFTITILMLSLFNYGNYLNTNLLVKTAMTMAIGTTGYVILKKEFNFVVHNILRQRRTP
ncbi:MAG: oligosaccharide flippase family protein [Nitrospirae bacterium]|nr:oligosaccharide flippase family protein [Nitrospirota bacterium]